MLLGAKQIITIMELSLSHLHLGPTWPAHHFPEIKSEFHHQRKLDSLSNQPDGTFSAGINSPQTGTAVVDMVKLLDRFVFW
jgi:hypothetical protein